MKKATIKKHDVSASALVEMPKMMASPIMVFNRGDNTLGVLTEMQDRQGRNVFVALEMKRKIQHGREVMEVNDIRSIHGREHDNVIDPIINNGTLKWVDKEKGLDWLSSASSNYQQEIARQDLSRAAKIIKDFENPKLSEENLREQRVFHGTGRVNEQVQM